MAKKWSDEEIQFLRFAYPNKDFTLSEIATALNRNKSSVSTKARSLGLVKYKEYIPDGYKRCSRCENILPLSFFTRRSDYKNRYRSHCRECRKMEYKEYMEHKHTNSVPTNSVPTNSVPTNSVPESKKCRDCNETKPISEFYKNKNMKDGYENYCRECSKIRKEKSMLKKLQERGW